MRVFDRNHFHTNQIGEVWMGSVICPSCGVRSAALEVDLTNDHPRVLKQCTCGQWVLITTNYGWCKAFKWTAPPLKYFPVTCPTADCKSEFEFYGIVTDDLQLDIPQSCEQCGLTTIVRCKGKKAVVLLSDSDQEDIEPLVKRQEKVSLEYSSDSESELDQ